MKILMVTKSFVKGGAATGARNLLGALCTTGSDVVTVDAFHAKKRHPIRAIRTIERLYERAFHDAETHCMRLGPPVFDLKQLFDQYRPDIIQLCDVSSNTIRFADIARVPCPVVHRMSDFWPYGGAHHYAAQSPERPDFADRILRRLVFDGSSIPDCLVAPSHWLAAHLVGRDVEVLRNAVSIPDNLRPRGPHKGTLRFGFISSQVLDPRKGFSSLPPFLEALNAKTGKTVELHIFGRCQKHRLPVIPNMNVVFHPSFSSDKLGDVYGTFDILLCPSRQDNSPNVVTEALAHGVPVIGQVGTGIASYIQSETGALVDFKAVNSYKLQHFSDTAQKISQNLDLYSECAYDYARQELSPGVIGKKYLALFNQLLIKKVS